MHLVYLQELSQFPMTVNFATATGPSTSLIDDDFTTGLDGWHYSSYANARVDPVDGYGLSWSIDANNNTSAHISGDGFAITPGMAKNVTLSDTASNIVLEFDAKGEANASFHTHLPNIRVDIFDTSDGSRLFGQYVVGADNPSSTPVCRLGNL